MKPIIFQYTVADVLRGTKTETRRKKLPYDSTYCRGVSPVTVTDVVRYIEAWGHYSRYEVGKEFAVLPGYGKPAVARAKCVAIWAEDVRDIPFKSVIAEGFKTWASFMVVWAEMHDKPALNYWQKHHLDKKIGYLGFAEYIKTRPAERYAAWAIRFELIPGSLKNLHLVPEYDHATSTTA